MTSLFADVDPMIEQSRVAALLGGELAAARARRGLSQEAVALQAGIAVVTLSNLERGVSNSGSPANPTMSTLLRLFTVLGIHSISGWSTQGAREG